MVSAYSALLNLGNAQTGYIDSSVAVLFFADDHWSIGAKNSCFWEFEGSVDKMTWSLKLTG